MSAEAFIPLFPSEQIPFIIGLVLDHAQTLCKQSDTETEDSLSDRLHKRVRLDPRLRSAPFSILREFRVYNDILDESGHSGRIDINFVCSGGDETYFAIEAKRLHVTFPSRFETLIAEYVSGDQGMMRFITGKYSSAQQAGAMPGYVFDGDIEKARKEVKSATTKHSKKLKLLSPPGFKKSTVVKRTECVDETCHDLGNRKFRIYHMLIPV